MIKEHYASKLLVFFPKWVEAFTLGNHVFYRVWCPKIWLRKHEAVHVAQYKELGIPCFLILYLYYNIKYGYKKNPLEIEAYAISSPPKNT